MQVIARTEDNRKPIQIHNCVQTIGVETIIDLHRIPANPYTFKVKMGKMTKSSHPSWFHSFHDRIFCRIFTVFCLCDPTSADLVLTNLKAMLTLIQSGQHYQKHSTTRQTNFCVLGRNPCISWTFQIIQWKRTFSKSRNYHANIKWEIPDFLRTQRKFERFLLLNVEAKAPICHTFSRTLLWFIKKVVNPNWWESVM